MSHHLRAMLKVELLAASNAVTSLHPRARTN